MKVFFVSQMNSYPFGVHIWLWYSQDAFLVHSIWESLFLLAVHDEKNHRHGDFLEKKSFVKSDLISLKEGKMREILITFSIIFRIFSFILYTLIFLLGMIGNTLFCYVVISSRCTCKCKVKSEEIIMRQSKKLANNKKSTFFVVSSWNLVNIITSWDNHFNKVSWG